MKRITIICLFLLVIGLMGCAGQKLGQRESDPMSQKKERCKTATIERARRLTHPEAQDTHWDFILTFPEYRNYYEDCLKRGD